MKKNLFIYSLLFVFILNSCKKKIEVVPPSSDKKLSSFKFKVADNSNLFTSDITGLINKDTIRVKVPTALSLTHLVPEIIHTGKSIAPLSKSPKNFTVPVHYLVTAADGSTINYIVIVTYMSSSKSIDSFVFKSSDNIGLLNDIAGVISNDTIKVIVVDDIDITKLVPTVSFTGSFLSPETKNVQNFFNTVTYTVTAEDGSTKIYKVVVSANATVFLGSTDGNLYAVDAATGTLKWKYNTGSERVASPCYYNGILYAGTKNGYLHAIDAATGTLKWKFMEFEGDYSYPSVHNGMVYFVVSTNFRSSYLYAIDTSFGTIIWKRSQYVGVSDLTIVNQTLYYGDSDGVIARDAMTGDILWIQPGGLTYHNPAVVNNKLYTTAEQVILESLNAETGAINWRYLDADRNNVSNSPTVDEDAVYIGSVKGLYSINTIDGTLKWKFILPSSNSFSCPIVANGLVYSGASNPYTGGRNCQFYALNKLTGTVAWRKDNFLEPATATSGATVAHGVVFVNGLNNTLYALNGATGETKWTFQANSSISTYLCVVDAMGKIFYNGNSGDQN